MVQISCQSDSQVPIPRIIVRISAEYIKLFHLHLANMKCLHEIRLFDRVAACGYGYSSIITRDIHKFVSHWVNPCTR